MRVFGAILVMFAALGLVLGGFMLGLVGFAEWNSARTTYEVQFAKPGADCGAGVGEASFDISDGEPLSCTPRGIPGGSGHTDLPGFTDSQNKDVDKLAAELGERGLTPAEQGMIQAEVERIAATVPEQAKPYRDQWIWGTDRIVLGAGVIAATALGLAFLFRTADP